MPLHNPIDRVGTFRATVREYGLKESKGGAIGCYLVCDITHCWNEETRAWDDWAEFQMDADGTVWLQKKDGELAKNAVKALIAAGWDADFGSIEFGAWEPKPIQIVTQENEYDGKVSFPINFVNEYDRVPGSMSIGADKVKELQSRHGSALRALAGNAKANGTKPSGKPGGPPKKPAPQTGVHTPPIDQPETQLPF